MDELYFLGVDIVEEVKSMVDAITSACTDGMTERELAAYKLGINNVLSVLDSTIYDGELPVVNIHGMETPTELSIDELEEFFSEI